LNLGKDLASRKGFLMEKVRGVFAVLVGFGLLAVPASAKTITLGGAVANSHSGCNSGYSLVQLTTATTSPSYSAPSDGVITSWATSSLADGTAALKIWRPTSDPFTFKAVAQSSTRSVPSGNKLTHFSASLPVHQGDRIGMALLSGIVGCTRFSTNSGDMDAQTFGDPSSGKVTFTNPDPSTLLNLSATFKPDCVVPDLVGKTLAAAKKALKRRDCTLGAVTKKTSSGKAGIVLSQKPKPGTDLPPGARVAVVVSKA
jgi:PASTA domain